jgi:hypothetical protein
VSTVLLNLMRATMTNPGGIIFNRLTQCIAYADDVAILGRNVKALKQTFIELTKEARKLGLVVNIQKTKYMIASQNMIRFKEVTKIVIEGTSYERTDKFEYLGNILNENDDMAIDIKVRLAKGNKCYCALNNLIKSKHISRSAKLNIYRTIIRSIVMYASETWRLRKLEEKMIITWERKILRRIFGPKKEDGTWKIRSNKE